MAVNGELEKWRKKEGTLESRGRNLQAVNPVYLYLFYGVLSSLYSPVCSLEKRLVAYSVHWLLTRPISPCTLTHSSPWPLWVSAAVSARQIACFR